MRLVHYHYKPEFAATVGIENTAETGKLSPDNQPPLLRASSTLVVKRGLFQTPRNIATSLVLQIVGILNHRLTSKPACVVSVQE